MHAGAQDPARRGDIGIGQLGEGEVGLHPAIRTHAPRDRRRRQGRTRARTRASGRRLRAAPGAKSGDIARTSSAREAAWRGRRHVRRLRGTAAAASAASAPRCSPPAQSMQANSCAEAFRALKRCPRRANRRRPCRQRAEACLGTATRIAPAQMSAASACRPSPPSVQRRRRLASDAASRSPLGALDRRSRTLRRRIAVAGSRAHPRREIAPRPRRRQASRMARPPSPRPRAASDRPRSAAPVSSSSGRGRTFSVTSVRAHSVPQRSGHQLGQIVAGDVLHHLAAGLERPRRGR